MLVAEAARNTGLDEGKAVALASEWDSVEPWEEAPAVLRELKRTHKVGIVTNCSERLGRIAAHRIGVPFDVVVTSERAGFYKPHPAPYRLALSELELKPAEAPFIARSGSTRIGTAASACGVQLALRRRCGNRAALLIWL